MRIMTAEYFEYQKLAESYDFPFHEIDSRASAYDEDLYRELVRRGKSTTASPTPSGIWHTDFRTTTFRNCPRVRMFST